MHDQRHAHAVSRKRKPKVAAGNGWRLARKRKPKVAAGNGWRLAGKVRNMNITTHVMGQLLGGGDVGVG